MTCPRCGAGAPSGASFCASCGAPLTRSCTRCGADVTAEDRFCGACGAPLAEPAPPAVMGERRPASILFADVVGFSTLAERLDPEELRTRMTQTFERITSAIRAEDGWVEKFIGDAVVAVFGMPAAHEDDPQRAVRAALAIQRALEEGDLRVRIGVNTGLVVTGPVGDGSEVGVLGDAVNVAARLQQLAEPGSVLVAESTYRLVRHLFETRPLGSLTVKGKTEQVVGHEVVAELEKPDRLRALAPLVGRESELTLLGAVWHSVCGGRPQLASIVGEPGVGKSRLVDEFAAVVVDEATVLRGTCPQRQAAPYAPIVEMLERAVGPQLDAPTLAATAGRLGVDAEAARLVGCLLGLAPMDAGGSEEEVRRRCFAALAELVAGFGRERPTLVIVEDVHWADPSTWDLVAYLVQRLPSASLALVVTYRPAFEEMGALRIAASHTVVRLEPLPAEQAETLARALAEGAMPDEVARAVAERAEGNPFFVEEIVRSLVDEQLLVRADGGWRLTRPVEEIRIPETVQGVILARIDRLPESAKRALQRASVIGREFAPPLLESISEGGSVTKDIEALERADLLVVRGGIDPQVEFKHALTQEVAYSSLLMRQRQELHRRLAATLERTSGSDPAALSYHWLQAGDLERARRYAIAAADAAQAVFAVRDADHHLTVALQCLGDERTLQRADLLLRLGDVRQNIIGRGTIAGAWRMIEEAAAIYEELGDRLRLAACLGRLGNMAYFHRGDYDGAVERLGRARDLLAEGGDSEELGGVLAEIALIEMVQGRPDGGAEAAERGLEIAERLGLTELRAKLLDTLGVGRGQQGRLEEALDLLHESIAISRDHDHRDELVRAYHNLNWLHYSIAGDAARAVEVGREGVAIAERLGVTVRSIMLSLNLGQALAGAGRFAEALEIGREVSEAPDPPIWAENFMHMVVAWAALHLGDIAGAREHGTIAVTSGLQTQESQHMVPCRLTLASCAVESGDRATAARELDEIATFFERSPTDRMTLSEDLYGCAMLSWSIGDPERGRRFTAWLEDGRGGLADPWSRACVATARAEAAAAVRDTERARGLFAEADAIWPDAGRPWQQARCLRRWAETVVPPGERRALLERALELIRTSSARLEEAKIEASLAEA